MRTILPAVLLVLAAGAAQSQDLSSATFTALAQGAQAQAAARAADARSLRAVLDRLLTGLGARPYAPPPGVHPTPVLAAVAYAPARVTGSLSPERL